MKPIFFLFLLSTFLFIKCEKTQKLGSAQSEAARYFSVPSLVSKVDNISVTLLNGAVFLDSSETDIFRIQPKLDGKWVKSDPYTYIFSPDELLSSGAEFELIIENRSIRGLPASVTGADFRIKVMEQDFDVFVKPLKTDDPTIPSMMLTGIVNTADVAEYEEVKKLLTADASKDIQWTQKSQKSFEFTIENLERKQESYTINLTFDGEKLGNDKKIERAISIPSLSEFSILSSSVNTSQPSYIQLNFSDNIDENQNLSGLFQLQGDPGARVTVEENQIRIFPTQEILEERSLRINQGLKNAYGYKLDRSIERMISFEAPRPEIKLVGSGSILPSTKGLHFPFEAIGLKSVQVSVIKIFEKNIPQFFQVNNYNGNEQIIRVGKPVFQGKIKLNEFDQETQINEWRRYHLDLSSLFEAEKGALYRVTLGMKPEDSAFPCTDYKKEQNNADSNVDSWNVFEDDGFAPYSSYGGYYYPSGYKWDERDNPCHVSYYNYNRSVSTSLLATDIGLISKIGTDNKLLVFTTSLSSASPIIANIQVLDYQLKTVADGKSNSVGIFESKPADRPFLIIAESNGQKSYLKLDDGSSISTSNFDVSGTRIKKGLKGFIYGERGVWRPGNDIFLSFILEDQQQVIPNDYPVKFELTDPTGLIKDEQINNSGLNGVYTFKTKTDTEDKTGNWMARIKVGNEVFSKRLKIETIKPNRLKINLEFSSNEYSKLEGSIKTNLSAKWLTGLNAGSLQAQVELSAFPTKTEFKGFPNFSFQTGSSDFYYSSNSIFDGQLDQNGEKVLTINPGEIENAPGKLRLRLDVKVFEPGGGFSIFGKSINYLPYSSFVGVRTPEANEYGMLKRDNRHNFEIASLDGNGNKISKTVKVEIYKLSWRWWWDQQNDYEANYVTRGDRTPVFSRNINTREGKGQVEINGKEFDWGRHMIVITDLQSGHKASDVFYMGWSENEKGGMGASFLSLTSSKESYNLGEEAVIELPSSLEGNALITLENGSSVLRQFWLKTGTGSTRFSFYVEPNMTPNIYVCVTLLQPHTNSQNDLPMRLYGILPLKIENSEAILNPKIVMSPKLSPGEEVTISVSEEKGIPMTYTVAVVDEGLLDITGFNTPDPYEFFNKKEALGVKTWDLYDDVLGAYGGRLERLLAIGGGDELDENDPGQRDERFKPVVQFMGPFQLESGATAQHSFMMPQYIGSVKTMLVARNQSAYGKSDMTTPVVQPLMVLGTLPRVLGPGETVDMPVNVQRYNQNLTKANLSLSAGSPYQIIGNTSSSVNFSKDSETAYFQLKVGNEIGVGEVNITATSGKEKSTHSINIHSRNPNPPQTEVFIRKISAGEKYEYNLELFGIEGTNFASFSASTLPALNLEKRLQYLISYPHGCIEQTTSSVFAQLFLTDLTDLDLKRKVKIEENIKEGIRRISKFQTYDGGFSYWPGNSDANQWGSNYATHFLLEAQQKGYYVPEQLLRNAVSFLKKNASAWSKGNKRYNDDQIQAYRLYILAIAGKEDLSAMNRMRNLDNLSSEAIERLAAAYAKSGRNQVAIEVLNSNNNNERNTNQNYWYSYGSQERDLAMRLETYLELKNFEEAYNNLIALADELSSDSWLSTQTTAYALLSIGKFVNAQPSSDQLRVEYEYGNQQEKLETNKRLISRELDVNNDGEKLHFTNNSEGSVFLTVTRKGTPLPGNEIANEKDLSLTIQYLSNSGQKIDVDNMKLGSNLRAIVTVRNTSVSTIRDIALTHIIPSGLEINNQRLQGKNSNTQLDYQDIRDDRILSYFDLQPNQSKSIEVSLTSAYSGRFYLPSITAEAMYDASKYAKTRGKWIDITK